MARKVERRRVLNFLISKRKHEEKFLQATEKFLEVIRFDMDEAIAMGAQPWELEDMKKEEHEGMVAMKIAEHDIKRYNEAIDIVGAYLEEEGVL